MCGLQSLFEGPVFRGTATQCVHLVLSVEDRTHHMCICTVLIQTLMNHGVDVQLESMKMDPSFLSRNVNEGFSGGEKKRNEILQLAVLEPDVAILDEIDSGLDVDALKDVSAAVNGMR